MKPNPPSCGNRAPYCHRAGQEMRCVKESEFEWVFMCSGCNQVNIITKPEYRRSLRERIKREGQLGVR